MSTPSPEAKQAAEKIISHTGANHFDLVVTMDYVQQAIDAATAKHTIEDYKTAIEQIVTERTAKLREELADAKKDAMRGWAGIGAAEERACIAEQKLAQQQPSHKEEIRCYNCDMKQVATVEHTKPFWTYIHYCESCGHINTESEWIKVEQPSAPTPEYCPCYSYMDGDTDPDCPMHGTHGKSLLKAPTPEVEKIARECAELLHRPHISEDGLRDGITQALAQARAPLVARIAQMEQWLADVGYSAEEIDKALESYRWVKPALTATGEAKK